MEPTKRGFEYIWYSGPIKCIQIILNLPGSSEENTMLREIVVLIMVFPNVLNQQLLRLKHWVFAAISRSQIRHASIQFASGWSGDCLFMFRPSGKVVVPVTEYIPPEMVLNMGTLIFFLFYFPVFKIHEVFVFGHVVE